MILQEKLDDARAKGRLEGAQSTLSDLVSEGVLTIAQAAEQDGIPIGDFEKLLQKN